jgi:serine/threonine-protein kinase
MNQDNLPEKVGPYRVTARLGAGGMAEALLAQREGELAIPVVIKRLLPHLSTRQRSIDMLVREARVGLRLRHPHIVRYDELGKDESGGYFIAMEYLAGLSLKAFCKRAWHGNREDLSATVAARIVADAAAGLHYAHTLLDETGQPASLIHRDISPDNLMVTLEGTTKVLDFGIVKAEGEGPLTKTGEVKGKMGFLSPELFEGAPADARSDVFALGVTLYWALTRRRPFRGKSEAHVLRAVLMSDVVPPRVLKPSVPEPVEEVVLGMLEKDPNKRIQTAGEVVERLETMLGRSEAHEAVARWAEGLSRLGEFDAMPSSLSGPVEVAPSGNEEDTVVRFDVLPLPGVPVAGAGAAQSTQPVRPLPASQPSSAGDDDMDYESEDDVTQERPPPTVETAALPREATEVQVVNPFAGEAVSAGEAPRSKAPLLAAAAAGAFGLLLLLVVFGLGRDDETGSDDPAPNPVARASGDGPDKEPLLWGDDKKGGGTPDPSASDEADAIESAPADIDADAESDADTNADEPGEDAFDFPDDDADAEADDGDDEPPPGFEVAKNEPRPVVEPAGPTEGEKRAAGRRRVARPVRPDGPLTSTAAKLSFMKKCARQQPCARRVLAKSKKLMSLPIDEAKRFPQQLDACVVRCQRGK